MGGRSTRSDEASCVWRVNHRWMKADLCHLVIGYRLGTIVRELAALRSECRPFHVPRRGWLPTA
jgi:hypothetical protein